MRPVLLVPLLCVALATAAEPPTAVAPVVAGPATAAADHARFLAALARAPGIVAARARVEAATLAQGAAGVLPDPMVGVDAGRERMRAGTDTTMYGARVEQPLPRWGQRDAERLMAGAQVQGAEAEFQVILGDLAAAVATAAIEADAAAQSVALLDETRRRTTALAEAVRARVAAGGALLGESLAIDTQLQQNEVEIADLQRRIADAQAEIRGRLGLPPDAELPPASWPDPNQIQVERNPDALRAQAAAAEARAAEQEALARSRPETSVGLIWEREAANTDDQDDKLSLALQVSLPVWRRAYDDAGQAARQRARAAAHDAQGAAWMARSLIGRAQRAAAQAARAQAAADAIAARAETEFAAIISQVGTGAASVTAALALQDRLAEARLQAIDAMTSSRLALADLWRLAPPELPASDATATRSPDDPHTSPENAVNAPGTSTP